MSEYVKIEGAHGMSLPLDVLDVIVPKLFNEGHLPYDFDFRALTLDPEIRGQIVRQDILASLSMDQPSGHRYLTDDHPDCVRMPMGRPLRPVLQSIDTDYHILYDLKQIARDASIEKHVAVSAWNLYVCHLDGDMYRRMQAAHRPNGALDFNGKERSRIIRERLSYIAIRDSALLDIYHAPGEIVGHGPQKQDMLRQLLMDNHPDLMN